MRVFINSGHGGGDSGAVGFGLRECDVVLKIGKRVEKYLSEAGLTVQLFQTQVDSDYALGEICDKANNFGADVFVSIHCNAAANTSANGTETFSARGSVEGRKLATKIHNQILSLIPELTDRGVKEAGYYVLAHTDMTAVLVETAFICNEHDAKTLVDKEDEFARAISNGVKEYLGVEVVTTAKVETSAKVEVPAVSSTTDIEKIAVLARRYESKGDPACVSTGVGDLGGISYGLYQLASKVGSVDNFVNWLVNYPDAALANYGKVLAKYEVNSSQFIKTWKELGTVDPGNFGKLQDEFIKTQYYDVAVKKLAAEGFNVDKHSDAIKAVIFSRAVQNGASGCVNLFKFAVSRMGYANLSYIDDVYFDKDLIGAVYGFLIEECDSAQKVGDIWKSANNFCKGSASVIAGLRNRFSGERYDALNLLN